MDALARAAFEKRIELSALCTLAEISPTIAYRYKKEGKVPTLPTIGKLEKALRGVSL